MTGDHWEVLGLPPGASADDVQAARRRLAKHAHPDVGGSSVAMQALNRAADAALAELSRTSAPDPHPHPQPSAPPTHTEPVRSRWRPRPSPGRPRHTAPGVRRDHPSFTIEALPAEAFEALLLAAAELGDLIDDDPPYRLEVALAGDPSVGRPGAWCELSLVPDAGASTVSLAVAAVPGYPTPDVDEVRDLWIARLNALNW